MAAFRFGVRADSAASTLSVGLAFKRMLDLVLGSLCALLALPMMLVIGVAIKLDSPGPVLYRPTRVGRGGQVFRMYKFRTMVDGAEAKLNELRHLNVATGMVKIPNDPRVTRVGGFLRRFSLDELPQLLNVVVGDMSLVGPRPHDLHELGGYDVGSDPRFSMRPGLTGLWQVSARNDPDLGRRMQLGHTYVRDWSLILDLTILAKTVPAVLRGQGGTVVRPASTGGGGIGELEPALVALDAIQPLSDWPVQEFRE